MDVSVRWPQRDVKAERMYYELIILTLLARWPLHGYLIAKITKDIAGPYGGLSSGRLYPLLAKLEAQELINEASDEASQGSGRRSRRYAITEAGRARFHELMMDTTSNPGDYQRLFWIKASVLHLLELNERLYLLDHYITYCQTHIFHYLAEIADMNEAQGGLRDYPAINREAILFTLERILKVWRLELASAQEWRARVVARAEGLDATPASATDHSENPETDPDTSGKGETQS
jgi:DNA-binding PadR family transcriptional regulator